MSERHTIAVKIVGGALALGVLGDLLFYKANLGLNAVLWTIALLVTGAFIFKKSGVKATRSVLWLAPAALLFGSGFAIHDSPGMWLVNLLGLGVCVLLISDYARTSGVNKMSLLQGTLGLLVTWLTYLADFFILFIEDVQWKALGERKDYSKFTPVARGLLVAVPVLLLFGGLMASADAVFRKMFTQIPEFDLISVFTHGVSFLFFAGLAAGVLRHTLLASPANLEPKPRDEPPVGGPTEAVVVLGTLTALFALFVAVQFRYFFGGQGLVLASTGLRYSEYARQGFFQLVAISALALPVLLATTTFARRGSQQLIRSFNAMAGLMVALLSVVMASAVQRMFLYIGESGLSELRLYTTAFMGWLALVYTIYCFTTMVGKSHRFTYASLVAGLSIGVVLNFARPGEWIARYNTALQNKTHSLDVDYLSQLGADAVPEVLAALPKLTREERKTAASWLLTWEDEPSDWRGFNSSRARASKLVKAQHEGLALLAPEESKLPNVWD